MYIIIKLLKDEDERILKAMKEKELLISFKATLSAVTLLSYSMEFLATTCCFHIPALIGLWLCAFTCVLCFWLLDMFIIL